MAVVLTDLLRVAHLEFLWREGLQRLLSTLVTRKTMVSWMALCQNQNQMKLGNSSRKIREFFKEQIMKISLLNNVIMLETPNILNTGNKLFDHLF